MFFLLKCVFVWTLCISFTFFCFPRLNKCFNHVFFHVSTALCLFLAYLLLHYAATVTVPYCHNLQCLTKVWKGNNVKHMITQPPRRYIIIIVLYRVQTQTIDSPPPPLSTELWWLLSSEWQLIMPTAYYSNCLVMY